MGRAACTDDRINFLKGDKDDRSLKQASIQPLYITSNFKNTIFALYEDTRRKFEEGPVARVRRVGGGLTHDFSQNLSLQGRFGKDYISSYEKERLKGEFFEAQFNGDLNERTNCQISFENERSLAGDIPSAYDTYIVSGAFGKQIFKRIRLNLSFFTEEENISI